MLVVDDLVAHVHRRIEHSQRSVDHIDGTLYAGAEPARLGEDNPHSAYLRASAAAAGAPLSVYSARYSAGSSSAMRRMISSVPLAMASRVIRPGLDRPYGSPNLTCTLVRRRRSRGNFTCSVPQIAAGNTGAPVRRAISALPGSPRPSVPPLRVPSGNMPNTLPRRSAS